MLIVLRLTFLCSCEVICEFKFKVSAISYLVVHKNDNESEEERELCNNQLRTERFVLMLVYGFSSLPRLSCLKSNPKEI